MTVNGGQTTHYLLDGQNVAQEGHLDEYNNFVPDVTYLSGPRGVEYRLDESTGQVRWYLYDGLGSVVAEVDENGYITATRKYDVYGAVRGDTGTPVGDQRFVGSLGHTQEDATGPADFGLIYMRARWMDPVVGRFLSEDPAGDGDNWYLYCENMPINGTDPDGRFFLLDDIMAVFEGIAMDAKKGARDIGIGATLSSKISQVVADHFWQIYGYLLNAGTDEVTFFVDKGGKGFGWATAQGAVRVFIHLSETHGQGAHIDFQSLLGKIMSEALKGLQ